MTTPLGWVKLTYAVSDMPVYIRAASIEAVWHADALRATAIQCAGNKPLCHVRESVQQVMLSIEGAQQPWQARP